MELPQPRGLALIYWQPTKEKPYWSGLSPGTAKKKVKLIFDTLYSLFM